MPCIYNYRRSKIDFAKIQIRGFGCDGVYITKKPNTDIKSTWNLGLQDIAVTR